MFIADRVTKAAVKHSRAKAEVSRRLSTNSHAFIYQSNVQKVYQKFFLDTLRISEKRLE